MTKLQENVLTSVKENDEIVELHISNTEDKYRLGNIYIGKVKKIVSNIQAAFIEIDKGVECYYDMTEHGNKPLRVGEELIVQISKEAIKTKQPAVTRKISFTGKYCVLTVGDNRISFSSKIDKEKREELRQFMEPYHSEKYGFILRTNAKGAAVCDIAEEINRLIEEYEYIFRIAPTRVCFSCLKENEKPYIADLKNIYQKSIHENMNILYASYDRIEKQIQELKKVQTKIKKRVSAGMIYENLIHDTPTYDKPYFSSIVHIHMGKKTQNVLDYIQDQSILAFVMNPDDTIIQVYGTITDHQDDQQDILWTKQEQAQYLPCYLKLSESIVDQVTLQRSLQQVYDIKKKPGKIIANYLITDKNDDYFQAWIELLD